MHDLIQLIACSSVILANEIGVNWFGWVGLGYERRTNLGIESENVSRFLSTVGRKIDYCCAIKCFNFADVGSLFSPQDSSSDRSDKR